MGGQSQKHGFDWENEIRRETFNLPEEKNNTDKYDINKEKNIFDKNENISIKVSGCNTICCSCILNFYDYDFEEKNTLIVIKYKQELNYKVIVAIYEINYSKELHTILFGKLEKTLIENYVNEVKKIPLKTSGEEAKKIYNYLVERDKIYKEYPTIKIKINPKVNRGNSRVQCSFNLNDIPKDYITYDSSTKKIPNSIRGKEISVRISSQKRKIGGITKRVLVKLCRQNKIRKYSTLNKISLIKLLEKNNINIYT